MNKISWEYFFEGNGPWKQFVKKSIRAVHSHFIIKLLWTLILQCPPFMIMIEIWIRHIISWLQGANKNPVWGDGMVGRRRGRKQTTHWGVSPTVEMWTKRCGEWGGTMQSTCWSLEWLHWGVHNWSGHKQIGKVCLNSEGWETFLTAKKVDTNAWTLWGQVFHMRKIKHL